MLKRILHFDVIAVCINIFLFIWIVSIIKIDLGFLDPVGKALSDFDVYDIYFSKLREEPNADTNIVLVNIGNLSRAEIEHQINVINRYSPKVIGLDALFFTEKDSQSDSVLADAFSKVENMVLVSKLDYYNDSNDSYDSLITSIDKFSVHTKNGFANLPDDATGSFRTIRNFKPSAVCSGKQVYSFAVNVTGIYDKDAADEFNKRENEYEMINYRGNYNKFYYIDSPDLFDETRSFSFIKNKIVLMGYMGTDLSTQTVDDAFFTPLNEKYAGRSFPDMYGIVIHANIVSMLLNRNYIGQMPYIFSIIFAIILCYINALILVYMKKHHDKWYNGFNKAFIFVQTVGNLFLGVWLFSSFNYRINLTLAIAVIVLVPSFIDLYYNYLETLYAKIKNSLKGKKHE